MLVVFVDVCLLLLLLLLPFIFHLYFLYTHISLAKFYVYEYGQIVVNVCISCCEWSWGGCSSLHIEFATFHWNTRPRKARTMSGQRDDREKEIDIECRRKWPYMKTKGQHWTFTQFKKHSTFIKLEIEFILRRSFHLIVKCTHSHTVL